jgi:DNA-binding NarL/FixJ family response regulator
MFWIQRPFGSFGVGLGGGWLATSLVRILVVDDHERWRQRVCSMLQTRLESRVIAEPADGLEAVQKALELKPDLILLDIGLPTLNGIEAARQIRKFAPESKIIFVSQESSADIVQEVLSLGTCGYVVKSQAQSDLLAAVDAVLVGRQFLSLGLSG